MILICSATSSSGNRETYDLLKAILVQFSMDFEILRSIGTFLTAPKEHPVKQTAPAIDTVTDYESDRFRRQMIRGR